MTYQIVRTVLLLLALLVSVFCCRDQVLAGPVLICHPFEIGNAKSLPWAGNEWRAVKKDYDLNRLVEDTLALLQPDTPVIVRMETLRRATIYAAWAKQDHEVGYAIRDDRVARELMGRLIARVREAKLKGKPDALALFDAGYFAESWKNTGAAQHLQEIDGYSVLKEAIVLRGNDAQMEFAAALITSIRSDKSVHQAHLRKAVAGAAAGSLLARNIVRQFGHKENDLVKLTRQ